MIAWPEREQWASIMATRQPTFFAVALARSKQLSAKEDIGDNRSPSWQLVALEDVALRCIIEKHRYSFGANDEKIGRERTSLPKLPGDVFFLFYSSIFE